MTPAPGLYPGPVFQWHCSFVAQVTWIESFPVTGIEIVAAAEATAADNP